MSNNDEKKQKQPLLTQRLGSTPTRPSHSIFFSPPPLHQKKSLAQFLSASFRTSTPSRLQKATPDLAPLLLPEDKTTPKILTITEQKNPCGIYVLDSKEKKDSFTTEESKFDLPDETIVLAPDDTSREITYYQVKENKLHKIEPIEPIDIDLTRTPRRRLLAKAKQSNLIHTVTKAFELSKSKNILAEEIRKAIDKNDAIALAFAISKGQKKINWQKALKYAVTENKADAAGCLLRHAIHTHQINPSTIRNLKILHKIFGICMSNIKSANQNLQKRDQKSTIYTNIKSNKENAKRTFKSLLLTLKDPVIFGEFTKELIETLVNTRQASHISPEEQDESICWVVKLRLGIPFDTTVNDSTPLLFAIKKLAEKGDVQWVHNNKKIIELLAKSDSNELDDPIKKIAINQAINIANALDNSDPVKKNTAFLSIFNGLAIPLLQNKKINILIALLLDNLTEKIKNNNNPTLVAVKNIIHNNLLHELSRLNYVISKDIYDKLINQISDLKNQLSPEEKTDQSYNALLEKYNNLKNVLNQVIMEENIQHHAAFKNVKILTEIIAAICNDNYGLARNLAKSTGLLNAEDQRTTLKLCFRWLPRVLIFIDLSILIIPFIQPLGSITYLSTEISITLFILILIVLPYLLKLKNFLEEKSYFAGRKTWFFGMPTLRDELQKLPEETSNWQFLKAFHAYLSDGKEAKTVTDPWSILSLNEPSDKHPLLALSGIPLAKFLTESKTIIQPAEGKEKKEEDNYKTWKNEFIQAVRQDSFTNTAILLQKAIDHGLTLASQSEVLDQPLSKRKDAKEHCQYALNDPLIQALAICIKENHQNAFQAIILQMKDHEGQYGKLTQELLLSIADYQFPASMTTSIPDRELLTRKNQFMLWVLQAKLSEPLSNMQKHTIFLSEAMRLMKEKKYVQNAHGMRTLATFSIQAAYCLNAANKNSKDDLQQDLIKTDINDAISQAADIAHEPITPDGRVDAFSAILYGLISKINFDEESNFQTHFIELMTYHLRQKIQQIDQDEEEYQLLKSNFKLIENHMKKYLQELFQVRFNVQKYSEPCSHLKTLVQYINTLCHRDRREDSNRIWAMIPNPQEQGIINSFVWYSANYILPTLLFVASALISTKEYTIESEYIGLDIPDGIAALISAGLVLLITFTAKWGPYLEKCNYYFPEPVKKASQSNTSDENEFITEAVGGNPLIFK